MPGPFPGMDPWLERPAYFTDLHNSLITYFADVLSEVLPEPYIARGATRVVLERQRREPDAGVYDRRDGVPAGGIDVAAALTDAGLIAVADEQEDEAVEEQYLEVRTSTDERLVTAIEFLSPTNKSPGEHGRDAYRQKQSEYLATGLGLVEIDLLRSGQHSTAVSLASLKSKVPTFCYHVCVSGAAVGPQRFVSAIRLEERLPAVQVPLDPGIPPVRVELQPLLDRFYDVRKCGRYLQYAQPPDPPLTAEQQAWAEGVLREKGLLK